MTSFIITLNHVRYGRYRFDLAELKRRLERAIAEGRDATQLGTLLIHTNRLMLLIAAKDAGRDSRELNTAMDAEFAFLLLGFDQVQAVMTGSSGETPKPLRPEGVLPRPPRKPPTRKPKT
jgi:hypothetical protein